MVQTTKYLPFGTTWSTSGSLTDINFTGHRLDASDGLIYMNARYYDPAMGRFVTPDTIVQNPYDPQILNRYAYCRNNPVNYTDPSGHFLQGLGVAMVVGAAVNVVYHVARGDAITFRNVNRWMYQGAVWGAAAYMTYTGGQYMFANSGTIFPGGINIPASVWGSVGYTAAGGLGYILAKNGWKGDTTEGGGPADWGADSYADSRPDPTMSIDLMSIQIYRGNGLIAGGGGDDVTNDKYGYWNEPGLQSPGFFEDPIIMGSFLVVGAARGALNLVMSDESGAGGAFGKGGFLNSNRYIRVGYGKHEGRQVFRISGNWVKRISRSGHIDLWKGPRR